jgi:drug/metabolite transporter (DMT)-like permease
MRIPVSLHGIAYMLAAMFTFSLMNNCIRFASAEMPVTQLAFFRNLFALMLTALWIALTHRPAIFRTDRLKSHLLRAALGITSIEIWFHAVTVMPLNQATALSFMAPVFTVLFAILFLKEKSTLARWGAVVLGFIGMLVILRPGSEAMSTAAMLVLVSGILIKTMTRSEHPDLIIFFQALLMTPLALPLALLDWQPLTLAGFAWAMAVAACSAGSHAFLTRAFVRSDMILLMPFDFSRLIFTAALAWLWFGETLDLWTVAGAAFIIAGSVWGAAEGNEEVKKRLLRLVSRRAV